MFKKITVFLFLSTFLVLVRTNNFRTDLNKVLKLVTYNSSISPTCQAQLKLWSSNLENFNEESVWAWQLVDATAKLQSGILAGNNAELGAFDECIDIARNTTIGNIQGKYCLGSLILNVSSSGELDSKNFSPIAGHMRSNGALPSVSLFWAACIPSGCTGTEITPIYNEVLNNYLDGAVNIILPEENCQTVETLHPELNDEAIAATVIFTIILGFMFFSSIYDLYLHYSKTEPAHVILISFSVITNGKKLFKINKNNPDQLPCLNGIRVISMFWIILGHQYSSMGSFVIINALKTKEWFDSLHSMYISGANLAVDTFLLLAGLLMAYGFFKSLQKGTPFNIFIFWLHRYLRLTPALAALILFSVTLVSYLGTGPLWKLTTTTDHCKTYWWSTLLYIQNWVNVDKICIGHSWYLSVDMQLFILSPLVLIPMAKWKKLGLGLLILLILVSIAIPFTVAWINNLRAMYDGGEETLKYMQKYYYMTHTRATPWLIGILLGFYIVHLKERKNVFKPPKVVVCFLWAASLSLLITCVFGGHSTLNGVTEYDKWANVSHITFIKPTWSIALSWLILACITGYGGPINSFLSLPIYQILGRLTYSMYLLHTFVLQMKVMSSRQPLYFSDGEAIYNFWGTTMFTAACSIVWVLAFESPMIIIEKVLFHKSGKPKAENNFGEVQKTLENC